MTTATTTTEAKPTEAPAPEPLSADCAISAAELGWPIERLVSLLAGSFTLVSLALGRFHTPRWRLMTGMIGANLVLQAVAGWCPASLAMRKLGISTAAQRALQRSASASSQGA